MDLLKKLSNSLIFLIILTITFVGVCLVAIFPMEEFVSVKSTSVVTNFRLVFSFFVLLLLSSGAQTLLFVRLKWGGKSKKNDPDDTIAEMNAMKVTGTKKIFILCALLLLNATIFDKVGGGILMSDSYRYHVLTQLRSSDPLDRKDGAHGSIQKADDKEITLALKAVMDKPGKSRHWAAYATGVRRDFKSIKSLTRLMQNGNDLEVAASAIALARMKDPALVTLVLAAWPKVKEHKTDLLIALGMVGKERNNRGETIFNASDIADAGEFLTELLVSKKLNNIDTRVAIWGLNKFESPEGLEYLESLVSEETDIKTLCITLEALGNIGAAQTSPLLIDFIYKVDRKLECVELVAKDFTHKQVLLSSTANVVARIIAEIAHIGDPRAIKPMVALAKDETFKQTIRNLAKEFVIKKQYGNAI